MYASEDPWGFEDLPYERRKYDITMASLPRRRYLRAFEAGCANGAFTSLLAERCERVLGLELVGSAFDRARKRFAATPNVQIKHGAIPEDWPEGQFDLIVVSEILYYFSEMQLRRVLGAVDASLSPAGHLAAVHYRGKTNYPLTGDHVHARLGEWWCAPALVSHLESNFILEIYEKPL